MKLSAINLNLLVALDALLATGSVTAAANKVGLSQPAMSNALARLRALLDDPLLVRAPDARGGAPGMRLTERALALSGPVRAALAGTERLLAPPAFEASCCERTFRLATGSIGDLAWAPPVFERMSAQAPRSSLECVELVEAGPRAALDTGFADLVLGPACGDTGPGLRTQRLGVSGSAVVVRRQHPRVGARLTAATFRTLSYVLVENHSPEEVLAAQGIALDVILHVSSFSAVPHYVAESDHAGILPGSLARSILAWFPVRFHAAPVDLGEFHICAYWHERDHRDPAHAWFRQVVADAVREVERDNDALVVARAGRSVTRDRRRGPRRIRPPTA
jgi:DNA-binding transcriptional LysR family regulator